MYMVKPLCSELIPIKIYSISKLQKYVLSTFYIQEQERREREERIESLRQRQATVHKALPVQKTAPIGKIYERVNVTYQSQSQRP